MIDTLDVCTIAWIRCYQLIKHVLLERTEAIKAFELPCRTQSCNLVIFESWQIAIIQYSNHSPFGDLQFRTEQADDLFPQRQTRLRQSGTLLGVWSLTRAGQVFPKSQLLHGMRICWFRKWLRRRKPKISIAKKRHMGKVNTIIHLGKFWNPSMILVLKIKSLKKSLRKSQRKNP